MCNGEGGNELGYSCMTKQNCSPMDSSVLTLFWGMRNIDNAKELSVMTFRVERHLQLNQVFSSSLNDCLPAQRSIPETVTLPVLAQLSWEKTNCFQPYTECGTQMMDWSLQIQLPEWPFSACHVCEEKGYFGLWKWAGSCCRHIERCMENLDCKCRKHNVRLKIKPRYVQINV